ncbi:MAG: gamma-glutamyl-gamma-aminobutyrate hydrolase family protein [Bacilli bacterium]|nr:gamma-glutamyl-gamma-aminobutyrate hydrolase family protein [Bacilli bacterium]
MKPVIGILGRADKNENDTSLFYIFEDLRRCIYDLGGEVLILLPPSLEDCYKTRYSELKDFTIEEEKSIVKWLKLCDGILFPGGFKLTKYDRYVLEYAVENDIPTLGICLGMQILSSYKEEINFTKIEESSIIHKQTNPSGHSHEVTIDRNSKLYEIIGKEKIMVNSFHTKQASPNKYYKVVATAPDGVIEGMELQDKTFNIGVQWHPERNYNEDENSRKILETFIKYSKEKEKIKVR